MPGDRSSVVLHRGEMLGDYEIQQVLGAGGAATVYLAVQTRLNREVAIKVISLTEENRALLSRFRREVQVLARLHHPNIVTILDFDHDDERSFAYYVMERAHADLASLETPLDWRLSLELVRQVAQGLHAFHSLSHSHDPDVRSAHRDVKPSNILLYPVDERRKKYHAKISDFGIAKVPFLATDSGTLTTSWTIGTPLYMSPEQIATPFSLTARTDVYSLGLVLYELLTGSLPLATLGPSGMPEDRMRDEVPSLERASAAFVPRSVLLLVGKMLRRNPEDRYASMQGVIDSISGILDGSGSSIFDVSPLIHERQPTLRIEGLELTCAYFPLDDTGPVVWAPGDSAIKFLVSPRRFLFFRDSDDPRADTTKVFNAKGDQVESINLRMLGAKRKVQFRVWSRAFGFEEQVTIHLGEPQRDDSVLFENGSGVRFGVHEESPWQCMLIHGGNARLGLLLCFDR